MGGSHRHGSVRKKVIQKKNKPFKPEIYIDHDSDYASIKLASGVEARSYVKDGFVFCEDKNGKVIEIQVLNLSELAKRSPNKAA